MSVRGSSRSGGLNKLHGGTKAGRSRRGFGDLREPHGLNARGIGWGLCQDFGRRLRVVVVVTAVDILGMGTWGDTRRARLGCRSIGVPAIEAWAIVALCIAVMGGRGWVVHTSCYDEQQLMHVDQDLEVNEQKASRVPGEPLANCRDGHVDHVPVRGSNSLQFEFECRTHRL